MKEQGVAMDHSSLNRSVRKCSPELRKAFHQRKRRMGNSRRIDETCISVKGQLKYLYRSVDKAGDTGDFLLMAKRDREAAVRFQRLAIEQSGAPSKITIDKRGANAAALESYATETEADIELRQAKYLNNIVEQRSPGNQTKDSSNDGIQIVLVGGHDDCRHRVHV